MKKFVLAALTIGLLVPAAAFAAAQNPTTFCKANPSLIGAAKTYRNMGDCVSKQTVQQEANTANASKACKAEMADANFAASHEGKTFAQVYGTDSDQENGKGGAKGNGNALGKCISGKASAKTSAQQTATVKAAKACKTDATLKAQIGAGKTYRNLGACVSAQAKKQQS